MSTKKSQKPIHIGNKIISALAIIIIIAGLVYFTNYFLRGTKYEETNDAQVESYINPVSARAGGYILKVNFEEHQDVKQGDTLVVLDDREYRARVDEAQAAVNDSYAQMEVLLAGIESAKTATLVNSDQINGAKARFWQQEQDIKRYRNLLKEEAVTGADFDAVKAKYDVAESDYHAAQNGLKTNVSKVTELASRKGLLMADLEKKKAGLKLARINLSYTVIRAPYSGRLGRRVIQEGQQIQAGQTLVSIVDEGKKWISANFKETQVSNMYPDQPVDIRIDAIDGAVYEGRIEAISASTGAKFSLMPPDNSTGNFVKIVQRIPVKIRFVKGDMSRIKAGMNVQVSVRNKDR